MASSVGRHLHHPKSLLHVTIMLQSFGQVYSREVIPGVLLVVLVHEIVWPEAKEDLQTYFEAYFYHECRISHEKTKGRMIL